MNYRGFVSWVEYKVRIFKGDFLPFLAPAGHPLTLTLHKINNDPYMWKYEESLNFGIYQWSEIIMSDMINIGISLQSSVTKIFYRDLPKQKCEKDWLIVQCYIHTSEDGW